MRHRLRWLLLAGALAFAPGLLAYELAAKVVGVLDGDTIDVLTPAKERVRIRLAGIDAPEKSQPFGNVAKQKLSDLVFGREVIVVWNKKDRYSRVVGKVLVNGADADLQMVASGLAWHYKKYAKEQSTSDQFEYSVAEITAREQRLGLWNDRDPIAPWDYRGQQRHVHARETYALMPISYASAGHAPSVENRNREHWASLVKERNETLDCVCRS